MLELFGLFIRCSALTFGGGYSMVAVFENEIVRLHQYMSGADFANLVGLAQVTPGPIGFNSATYVGFAQGGLLGASVASLGVMVPSLTLTLLVAVFLQRMKDSKGLKIALKVIRPYVLVVVALAAWFFLRTCLCWQGVAIFAAVLAFRIWKPKVNPVYSLLAAAAFGYLLFLI